MKFHKKDDFYLSYSCDGISLGIDIQLAGRKQKLLKNFIMNYLIILLMLTEKYI